MTNNYNIIDAAKDALTGKLELADRETIIARTSICDPCEVRNKIANVCTICSCFIPAKVRLKESSCPMELW